LPDRNCGGQLNLIQFLRRLLPARLTHSWNFTLEGELPQTDTAKTEFPVICPRAAASLAAVVLAHLEFWFAVAFLY